MADQQGLPRPAATAEAAPQPNTSESARAATGAEAVSSARDRLEMTLQGESKSEKLEEPHVFSLFDRRVVVRGRTNASSVYVLCRRWMHNDPEQCDAEPSNQAPLPHSRTDPPEAVDLSSVPPLPGPVGEVEGGSTRISDLRAQLLDRSLSVRSHIAAKRTARVAAYEKRISKLLDSAAASAGS